MSDKIELFGVTTHNLRNIDIAFSKNTLTVVTGVSGSGKSSLAFTTLCNEGQRRYLESLSTYARMFIGGMSEEAHVREIRGLTPTVSIEQKTVAHNPRSTVGTITEIYDFYRLLFVSLGTRICPNDGTPMIKKTHKDVMNYIVSLPSGTKLGICAQVRKDFKTGAEFRDFVAQKGFVRYVVDNRVYNLSDPLPLQPSPCPLPKGEGTVSEARSKGEGTAPATRGTSEAGWILVDRVELDPSDTAQLDRISQSVTTAFEHGEDVVGILDLVRCEEEQKTNNTQEEKGKGKGKQRNLKFAPLIRGGKGGFDALGEKDTHAETINDKRLTCSPITIFSRAFRCPHCGLVPEELTLSHFSFNSPTGACPTCHGLGSLLSFTEESVIDPTKSVEDGCVMPWTQDSYYYFVLEGACKRFRIPTNVPYARLNDKQKHIILHGATERLSLFTPQMQRPWNARYPGIISYLDRVYHDPETSEALHEKIEPFVVAKTCETCHGYRVGELARNTLLTQYKVQSTKYKIQNTKYKEGPMNNDQKFETMNDKRGTINEASGIHIGQLVELSVEQSIEFFDSLELDKEDSKIAGNVLRNIRDRLKFLKGVGLNYMTLSRRSNTLSGGESQRIRLATQIGTKLEGITYVLDEPSIGLHARDSKLLIDNLKELVKLGNTVIVVEHDEEIMHESDEIIDIGPGAGVHGGQIVFQGTFANLVKSDTETGAFLRGEKSIAIPGKKIGRSKTEDGRLNKFLHISGATENNLQNVSVDIPLEALTVVTGVSGSGKSSLINRTLAPMMRNILHRTRDTHGPVKSITGHENLDKVVIIDQMPIGKTPRSNPATYTGVFTDIRDVFAQTLEARARGYGPGHFSFNTKQGRCDACEGDGVRRIQMHFLPDVHVTCEACQGSRYNHLVREVFFHDKSIADVLAMTIEEGYEFFDKFPKIKHKLRTLLDVGLGYITLGQSALTLSGGESQRVKLATELSRRSTGKTLYIMDEPTTGLHFSDIQKLMSIIANLVERGNTVIVIEHHLDVIANAHWIVDMGPEGGEHGGRILFSGPRDELLKVKGSYTAECLKEHSKKLRITN